MIIRSWILLQVGISITALVSCSESGHLSKLLPDIIYRSLSRGNDNMYPDINTVSYKLFKDNLAAVNTDLFIQSQDWSTLTLINRLKNRYKEFTTYNVFPDQSIKESAWLTDD